MQMFLFFIRKHQDYALNDKLKRIRLKAYKITFPSMLLVSLEAAPNSLQMIVCVSNSKLSFKFKYYSLNLNPISLWHQFNYLLVCFCCCRAKILWIVETFFFPFSSWILCNQERTIVQMGLNFYWNLFWVGWDSSEWVCPWMNHSQLWWQLSHSKYHSVIIQEMLNKQRN